MKILVTGANGFVGSAVVREARARGHEVCPFTRLDGDLGDGAAARRAVEGVETVIHAAGSAHLFHPTARQEAEQRRVNVDATRTFVEAARSAGVMHFVLVSSVSVHGGSSRYARTKIDGEQAAREAAGPMRLTIVRPATVYGPGDPGNVLRLIRAVDRFFVRIGDGSNRKTLIYVDDAAAGLVTAATCEGDGCSEEAYDLAAPPVTMREIVDAIADALGRPRPRLTIPAAPLRLVRWPLLRTFLSDQVFDPAPFARRYGFTACTALREGIAREVTWFTATRSRR